MKLTWFGGTTLRVYVGGQIVVIDGDQAPAGIDRGELLAGADRVVSSNDAALPVLDSATWRPMQAPRGMDDVPPLEIFGLAAGSLLVAAAGEPPLVVLGSSAAPRFGRWTDGAVVVLTTDCESIIATATVLLDVARPRLIALAADEQTLDSAIEELAEHLDGAGLVSLEPGLAVEV